MEDDEERMPGKKLHMWSKMREMRKSLDRAGVPYFTATVTQSALEVPAPFVRDYGGQMKPEAIIRLESGSRVWPVVIQVTYSIGFRVRFSSLWKSFLRENGLKEGDGLILSLTALSEFVVYAFSESSFEENQIQFRKELTESCTGHFGNPRSARMEIPVEFVRCYRRFLPVNGLVTLEGPTPGHSHQVLCHHGPQVVTRIMLRRGWHKFVKHNKLERGDELLFTLTAPNHFLVQQIKNQWTKVDPSYKAAKRVQQFIIPS